jgi:hypothetical protein
MTTYCFDIDGTLCSQQSVDYSMAVPNEERIMKVNQLFDQGHTIKLFTARGSKSGIDWTEATKAQMSRWGIRHHELILGKPHADFYIDDKAIHSNDFSWNLGSVG